MPIRKSELANGEYYHIYSRSIAKYVVFNDDAEFDRILKLMNLYRFDNFPYKLSQFMDLEAETQVATMHSVKNENDLLVNIISFCLMPTHIHFILKQIKDNGIEKYMGRILNAYSRYFNEKHHRNGPLWTGRFKNVLVKSDEQLLHLSRYIHLNPTSAGLTRKPEEWNNSSYHEYIDEATKNRLCNFEEIIDMDTKQYRNFVNNGKDYQRNLSIIKYQIMDDYTG